MTGELEGKIKNWEQKTRPDARASVLKRMLERPASWIVIAAEGALSVVKDRTSGIVLGVMHRKENDGGDIVINLTPKKK